MRGQKIFLAFSCLTLFFTILNVIKLPEKNIIDAKFFKYSKLPLLTNKNKNSKKTLDYSYPNINFPLAQLLQHQNLKIVPIKENFRAEFTGDVRVLKDTEIEIIVKSDDGFRFIIDKKVIIQDPNLRKFIEVEKKFKLTEGSHKYMIDYFQAKGDAGLIIRYKAKNQKKYSYWGDSSGYLLFNNGK